jgi:hypothetical protein
VADEITIHDLLRIEDTDAILDLRCPDTELVLWPQIRIALLRMIMMDLLFSSKPASGASKSAPLARRLGTLGRSAVWNFLHSSRRQREAEICIVSEAAGNQWVDGKLSSRVTGYFSGASPSKMLTLEEHFEWEWHFPRHDERVIFLAPLRAYQVVTGRLQVRAGHRRLASELIDLLAERCSKYLNWTMGPQRARLLTNDLARKLAAMPRQYRAYERMLARIRPRLLMISCGCFGGAHATLIAAARSAGIATAEYQHGAVSAGHDGYNFAPAIRASAQYRRTLPDYFLSYGEWWNGQINVPLQPIVIGSPHRDAQLAKFTGEDPKKTDVLFLSDGIEFETYLDLAKAVEPAVSNSGLNPVIRPHPIERSLIRSKYGNAIGGIRVDQNSDLMTSLQKAKIIVSEISTGLFEAIGVTENIYLWETPKSRFTYPQHPFQVFASAKELGELINASTSATPKLQADAFWAPNWKHNYTTFLATLGIGSSAVSSA